jgi:hypothetical protein
MRGAGVGIPAGPTFRSPPEGGDPKCGSRVETTDRLRISSEGRTPRLAVGTNLPGVAATWGAVWIG